jgi:hypothetical protein
MKTAGKKIGYIMGSGDEVPEALREIGYEVTLLSDEDIKIKDLAVYDSIVIGVRAYNTHPGLKRLQAALLEYVRNGGTMIVQYQTTQDLDQNGLGPYPFRVSRDRVSVEESAVIFLKPDHPLLHFPNEITASDLNGWVQERGLYFADQWDPQYETVFECHDPGEPERSGGMLYTRYGKGVYIFSAYSWFRQLPAGVPGAYRIFVNMLSAGKADVR